MFWCWICIWVVESLSAIYFRIFIHIRNDSVVQCFGGVKMWKDSRSHLFPSGTFHEDEVVCGCCVSTNQMWYAILSRLLHRTSANVNNLSDRFAWHWVLWCYFCCRWFILHWPWNIVVDFSFHKPCCYSILWLCFMPAHLFNPHFLFIEQAVRVSVCFFGSEIHHKG